MSLLEQLEQLVDQNNLQDVLHALAEVCIEKAEHIQVNYQDTFTANLWTSRANTIGAVANRPMMSDR
jgi:hypothetical protein